MKLLAAVALSGSLLLGLTGCPDKSRNESMTRLKECTKAYGAKQTESAIEHCSKAADLWKDNHKAWFVLAGAYANKADWAKAADAMQSAVQAAPDEAMYRLYYGRFLYEKAIATAREDQARRENKKPEEIQVDLANVNFEKAMGELQQAVKLNPDLWRAHYYIGRIHRDKADPKPAAEAISKALSYGPIEPAPWIALAELYRKWDYTDQALQIAQQGVTVVPGANEVAEIWYVAGMAYDDKRMEDKAIEAFDKALESRSDYHKAKFQRGQAYFRKGDFVKAKKDLEEFSKGGGTSLEFEKQQASKMLLDIAAKSAMAEAK